MKKLLLLVLLTGAPLFSQTYYSFSGSYTASGNPIVLTVQQPITPTKNFRFVGVEIDNQDSSNGITFTAERNGGTATVTAGTYVPVNPQDAPGTALVFTTSNAGAGSVIGNYFVAPLTFRVIDLSKVYLPFVTSAPTNNFTLRSGTFTGTVKITIVWQELSN
jgi:hypothetical protein